MKPRIARETYILAALCMADLLSTMYLLINHLAFEANPLFGAILTLPYGLWLFALAKIALTTFSVCALEYARKYEQHYVKVATWIGICVYVSAYVIGWYMTNVPPSQ